jgi:MurNAc alpha-1-phosphate uridylyltransferase
VSTSAPPAVTTAVTTALILAAGRGERMRPLTDHTPKPLLAVHGQPLIAWHLQALARDGITDVVINTAHLEDQFVPALGDGSRFGLRIHYLHEGALFGGALETAGGMANALPLLGDAFWVMAGDVYVPGFRFDAQAAQDFVASEDWGRIWLVPNPPHVPQGDFALSPQGRIQPKDTAPADWPRHTYSTIGLYRPALVDGLQPGVKAALKPWLDRAIAADRLSGQVWPGPWTDVGTPERLAALNAQPWPGATAP